MEMPCHTYVVKNYMDLVKCMARRCIGRISADLYCFCD